MIVGRFVDGRKLVVIEVTLTNTDVSNPADVSSTVTVDEVIRIDSVVGYARLDDNNSGVVVTLQDPNKVVVTAKSVPAASSTTVRVAVVGY